MAISMLAAFWLLSFSLVMVPGADWAYAIAAGMREKALAPALGGMLLGYLMITAVVSAGVGALVASVPSILSVLTVLGAGYLLWLGGNVLARPAIPTTADGQAAGALGWLARGFVVSGMNPKALLLFLALLPQFTNRSNAWPVGMQIAALGLVQIANCALVYSLVGLGAKIVLRTRPKVARLVSQFSGLAMLSIGVLLLAEQVLAFSR